MKGKETKPERLSLLTAQTSETAIADYDMKLEEWTKKAKKARKMILSTIFPFVMTYVEGTKDQAEM